MGKSRIEKKVKNKPTIFLICLFIGFSSGAMVAVILSEFAITQQNITK